MICLTVVQMRGWPLFAEGTLLSQAPIAPWVDASSVIGKRVGVLVNERGEPVAESTVADPTVFHLRWNCAGGYR
jgi:hypothetical protein